MISIFRPCSKNLTVRICNLGFASMRLTITRVKGSNVANIFVGYVWFIVLKWCKSPTLRISAVTPVRVWGVNCWRFYACISSDWINHVTTRCWKVFKCSMHCDNPSNRSKPLNCLAVEMQLGNNYIWFTLRNNMSVGLAPLDEKRTRISLLASSLALGARSFPCVRWLFKENDEFFRDGLVSECDAVSIWIE